MERGDGFQWSTMAVYSKPAGNSSTDFSEIFKEGSSDAQVHGGSIVADQWGTLHVLVRTEEKLRYYEKAQHMPVSDAASMGFGSLASTMAVDSTGLVHMLVHQFDGISNPIGKLKYYTMRDPLIGASMQYPLEDSFIFPASFGSQMDMVIDGDDQPVISVKVAIGDGSHDVVTKHASLLFSGGWSHNASTDFDLRIGTGPIGSDDSCHQVDSAILAFDRTHISGDHSGGYVYAPHLCSVAGLQQLHLSSKQMNDPATPSNAVKVGNLETAGYDGAALPTTGRLCVAYVRPGSGIFVRCGDSRGSADLGIEQMAFRTQQDIAEGVAIAADSDDMLHIFFVLNLDPVAGGDMPIHLMHVVFNPVDGSSTSEIAATSLSPMVVLPNPQIVGSPGRNHY